jgi:hypothetical protein
VKAIDAVIILAVVAIDDLRNAIAAFLSTCDVATLAVLLLAVYLIHKNQGKLTKTLNFEALSLDLAAPLKKLSKTLDPDSGAGQPHAG